MTSNRVDVIPIPKRGNAKSSIIEVIINPIKLKKFIYIVLATASIMEPINPNLRRLSRLSLLPIPIEIRAPSKAITLLKIPRSNSFPKIINTRIGPI